LKEDTCRKYGYSVGTYKGSPVQIANYYSRGKLVAQHLRYPDKEFSWLGKATDLELFGQHLWPKGGRRVVVTEGEIDAMTIAQAQDLKWPVVSIPSGVQSAYKYLKANLEWLESYSEIVIAFDADEAGKEGVDKCAHLFTPGKVRVMAYDGYKDANELYLAKGPASVVSCLFQAQTYRPDGIIAGTDLWDEVMKPSQAGTPILYPKLSKMTEGVRPHEFWLFTAGSGIGKSTTVHEVAYDLMVNKGKRLGVIALEEPKKKTAERYLGINLNTRISHSRDKLSKDKLRQAFEYTVGSGKFFLYDHFGSLDSENLLGKIRYMIVGLNCDVIVLDHISIVVSGMEDSGSDERKTIDKLMTHLVSMIQEADVSIMAVVHLKRTQKNYNEGAQVSLTDLRGSGSLEQLSHVVVALERNQQAADPNKCLIRVLKCRETGVTGLADELEYDSETGRLLAIGEVLFVKETDNKDF
jgi:twinkle protein